MPPSFHHSGSIADLLEPAIDGPPSPESIRAVSNQMRRASVMDKHQSHQSHQTCSSGSSSLRSISGDRPSWDHALDNAASSLSRKSSGRSVISVQPQPRDRDRESVQIFGKTLFSKRTRMRRESAAQISPGGSLYPAESYFDKHYTVVAPPLPPASAHGLPASSSSSSSAVFNSNFNSSNLHIGPSGSISGREALKPSFFNRRRATKSASTNEDADIRRKLQISGPYNFQHLTHTDKEHIPVLRHASCSDSSGHNSYYASHARSRSRSRSHHFPDLPPSVLHEADEVPRVPDLPAPAGYRQLPLRQHAASVSSVGLSPRSLAHTRSQDQLRIPPPRPPRSPIESSSFWPAAPPAPPPRMSSRGSLQYDDHDPLSTLSTATADRPRTSGSFRLPPPLALSTGPYHARSHAHAHSQSFSADVQTEEAVPPIPADYQRFSFSQMPAAPPVPQPAMDAANWPLPPTATYNAPSTSAVDILPGVPEEEEHTHCRHSVRRSHAASIASTSSSLRISHSLPMLRESSVYERVLHGPSPSNASETLGHFDLMAAQRALRQSASEHDNDGADALPKESWEDDIDYCYEHAVEADCEYAWDRSSVELSRDSVLAALDAYAIRGGSSDGHSNRTETNGYMASPHALSPGCFDMPALSPASQTSMASIGEVFTPTGFGSLRRPDLTIEIREAPDDGCGDDRAPHGFVHARSSSRASSFKESHGFNLSPTLFIPNADQYSTHFLGPCERVGFALGAADDDDDSLPALMDGASTYHSSRISASTTGSRESADSILMDRHMSAASTATDLTRLTRSTASFEDMVRKAEAEAEAVFPVIL